MGEMDLLSCRSSDMAKTGQRSPPSSHEESWRLLRCSQGEKRLALWSEMFGVLQPRLAVFLHYRMSPTLRHRWPVEDVIQDTFLVAWKRIDTFKCTKNDGLYRWLVTIAFHVLSSIKRREFTRHVEKRFSEFKGPEDSTSVGVSELALAASAERVSRRAMSSEEARRALEYLNSLATVDREVILLRVFEDLSYGDVAARLGLTETAARKRYQRALSRLQSLHGDLGGLFS